MEFALSEQEKMVVEMSTAYAERWLGDGRDHEAAGAVPDPARAAFDEAGLGMLAADAEDFSEIGWPARCAVLAQLAKADAATTVALWMCAAAPRMALRLGATAPTTQGLTWAQVVDDVDTVAHLPYALLGGGDRVLLVDHAGAWTVAQVDPQPTHALALHAAGPARCAVTERLAQGADDAATTAIVAELRLVAAAVLVGVSHGAKAYAAEYMETRKTFGKTLNQHQGLAFIFADMAMATAGAELLLQKAAWTEDDTRALALADAYVEAVESAQFVTSFGVQLLGGHGFMTDHPVEKWMREARAVSLLWGGVDAARRDAARGEA